MSALDISPETILSREFVLERMRVAGQVNLGRSVLESMEVESMTEMALDGMALRLRAEVLSERVLDTDARVPWSGVANVDVAGSRTRGLPALFGVAAVLGLAAPWMGLALAVTACLLALLAVVLIALNPPLGPYREGVLVHGEVTVPATYWRRFPESDVTYPDTLGRPVKFCTLGTPYWEQHS